MKPPRSMLWRVSLSYAALALAFGAVTAALAALAPNLGPGAFIAAVAVIGVAAAGLAIALGYVLVYRTSRSIASIAQSARELASGDLDQQAQRPAAGTEDLASAFNQMAETVRGTVRDLSGERNKLTAALNTMADGIIVIDGDGRVSLMNQAAQLLLEVRTTDFLGAPLAELARDHEMQALVSGSMQARELRQAQLDLLHQRRLVSAIATPLGDDGVLLTLHDLTRFRQLETTRKEFVSNVSHELRSPLASVRSMVETLEGGALDDRLAARDFIARIEHDVHRMESLVSELLELSRLESGQMPLDVQPVSLKSLAVETAAAFHDRGADRGVSVEIEIPDGLPLVMGEADKISQVLTNLMDNAIKFTEPSGKVTVSALPDQRFVTTSVSNTGDGIAPEHLPHLFERFYKVDRSRRDKGTGLGLAIAKHIVLAHGGEALARSELGEGATFSFTLPRAS